MTLLFLWGLKGPEILIIALVILLLFGAGKIPQMMRNLGKGVHNFKQGIEDAKAEINKEVKKAEPDTTRTAETKADKSGEQQ